MTSPSHTDVPIVEVRDLIRHFRGGAKGLFGKRTTVHAVDGINFVIRPGETLGLVGESGCGKSTTGRLVLGIDQPTSGEVLFMNEPVADLSVAAWRKLRCDLQMVFQDPNGALDPRIAVGAQIREPLDIHQIDTPNKRNAKVNEMLDAVNLPRAARDRFPHELSGGQQQRVVIARALILRPKMIVCDEPVSALDVSVQAQVVNLLASLQKRFGLAYLFISHDLAIVRHICQRVAVMYLGEIVETADKSAFFSRPIHPYSQSLISAIPIPDPDASRDRILLKGDPPSPMNVPSGCRFHTRCPYAERICTEQKPKLQAYGETHSAACHFADRWLK